MALGRSPPPEIRSPEERGAAEAVSEEEEVFDDAFDIPHKNAPHDRLRRWRQAALVLNASRRFRYTLDLKKEEEKEIIRRKIRSHAQVIRAAFLFKEAGQKDIRGMTTSIPFMGIDPPPCRADHGIKEGKSEWVIATPASHHAIRKHIHTGFIIDPDHDDSFIHAVDGIPMKVSSRAAVFTDTVVHHNVWFVPGLSHSLVSVGQLAELHYSVRIGCSQCCIKGLFASCSPRQHSRQAGISAPGVRNRTHWTPGSTAWARQYFQATKQTSPNGAGDGMIVGTAHNRGIDSCSKDDYLQATQRCVHMMNGAEGTADQPMHAVFIIDSAAALHCTGDRILLSEYAENKQPDGSISGASGTVMPILGVGSICNGRFQVKDVKYMPSLNRPNINKTIFSVRELVKLGYSVHFSGAHCLVMDNRKFTWSWKTWKRTPEVVGEAHLEHGQFMVDYLRIPADRTPATTSERETLAASFWKAASSGWTSMTGLMTHQKAGARRPPV